MRRVPTEVRRAAAEDVEDVLLLWTRSREELDRGGRSHVLPHAQLRSRLLQAMAAGEVEVLLARTDRRVAGFAMVRVGVPSPLVEIPAVHLEHLWVEPDLRRHGVARALLNVVVARADRNGADQVVAGVAPYARDTHRFFARLGFTPVVVRRAVPVASLRRRLAGESPRGALEDLLSRRRSLRARRAEAADPEAGPEAGSEFGTALEAAPEPAADEVQPSEPGAPASVVVPEPADVPRPA